MPITALAIGAAVGLLKSQTVDAAKEKRDRKLAAETQRLSPWTGMTAAPIKEADPAGSALAFGGAAAQGYSGYKNDKLNAQMADKYLNGGGGGAPAPSPMMDAKDPNEPWWNGGSWGGVKNYGG